MKKMIAAALTLMMIFTMAACGNDDAADNNGSSSGTFEIAMITDIGSIDDKSFNQGTWEGVKAYADANDVTCKYYKPTEQSNDAYLASIALAVEGGAKVVVTPGYLFEVPIYMAQDQYPDVTFILIDGKPHDAAEKDYTIKENTTGIVYAEEQSGYLAGYAAVKDGYKKLGFMGGMAVPAVIRYGYGFAQGAEAAAAELGIKDIELKYAYTGGFEATPEAQNTATSWYSSGTEVIFACGGPVGNSVMSAAEAMDKAVIGVDVDQSSESDTVITSAMKGLAASVEDALEDYYAGNLQGGQVMLITAEHDGVMLPMKTSQFKSFSQQDYETVYEKLASGNIKLVRDTDENGKEIKPNELPLSAVKLNVIE